MCSSNWLVEEKNNLRSKANTTLVKGRNIFHKLKRKMTNKFRH